MFPLAASSSSDILPIKNMLKTQLVENHLQLRHIFCDPDGSAAHIAVTEHLDGCGRLGWQLKGAMTHPFGLPILSCTCPKLGLLMVVACGVRSQQKTISFGYRVIGMVSIQSQCSSWLMIVGTSVMFWKSVRFGSKSPYHQQCELKRGLT